MINQFTNLFEYFANVLQKRKPEKNKKSAFEKKKFGIHLPEYKINHVNRCCTKLQLLFGET